jgi:hypothetical protein
VEETMNIPTLGKQPPRYTFFLNPYVDARFTNCPACHGKTRQKKLPLVIHVDEGGMILLNKTCRYCPGCDLLIAHKDEIEAQLTYIFQQRPPGALDSDYLVIGTCNRPDWQRGRLVAMRTQEMIDVLHDFKDVVQFQPLHGWGREERRTPATATRDGRRLSSQAAERKTGKSA